MPKYIIIISVFVLAVGISRGGEFPRQKPEQPQAIPSVYTQTDQPRPERRFRSDRDRREFGDMHGEPRAERKHLEKLRLSKLLELLELSEEQREDFLPLFKESRKNFRQTIRKRGRAVEKLGLLLKRRKTSDAEIQSLIDKVSSLEKQRISEQKGFMDSCRKILTTVQFGKLIVFQDKYELKMLGKLRGFLGRRKELRFRQEQPRSSTYEEEETIIIENDSEQ